MHSVYKQKETGITAVLALSRTCIDAVVALCNLQGRFFLGQPNTRRLLAILFLVHSVRTLTTLSVVLACRRLWDSLKPTWHGLLSAPRLTAGDLTPPPHSWRCCYAQQ